MARAEFQSLAFARVLGETLPPRPTTITQGKQLNLTILEILDTIADILHLGTISEKERKKVITKTMAPSKSNAPEYSKDEKVLCFHLELLYEAKVLEVKQKDPNDKGDGFVYKIHYKGWKNTYVSRRFPSFVSFSSF